PRRLKHPIPTHSFPTRRSSDLARRLDLEVEQRRDRGAVLVADLRNDFVAPIEVVEAIDVAAAEQRAQLPADAREIEPQVRDLIRSEEHTSELQSRSDLVCRLLL